MSRRRKRAVTDAETDLFRRVMRDVTPLRRLEDKHAQKAEVDAAAGAGSAMPPAPPAMERRSMSTPLDISRLAGYTPGLATDRTSDLTPTERKKRDAARTGQVQPAQPVRGDHPGLPGRAHQIDGLDGRTWGRLKRGRLPMDARIDLHGMTQHEAQSALTGFIMQAQSRGARNVLVITGKGTPRTSDQAPSKGRIRAAMPHWLAQPPLNRIVITWTEAQPRDGGSGAFYLRLRRVR